MVIKFADQIACVEILDQLPVTIPQTEVRNLKFTWSSRRIIVYDCRSGAARPKEHYRVYVYSTEFCWSGFITGWVTINRVLHALER